MLRTDIMSQSWFTGFVTLYNRLNLFQLPVVEVLDKELMQRGGLEYATDTAYIDGLVLQVGAVDGIEHDLIRIASLQLDANHRQ